MQNRAQNYVAHLNNTIITNQNTLYNLRSFFDASDDVSADEFAKYTQQFLQFDAKIKSLQWVPYVSGESFNQHVNTALESGFSDYQLIEKVADNRYIKAPVRDYYYPAYYISPPGSADEMHGYNYASDPDYLEDFIRARDSGFPVISKPLNLTGKAGDKSGFIEILAVYKSPIKLLKIEQRRQSHIGYIVAEYVVEDLLSRTLDEVRNFDLFLKVVDITYTQEPATIFDSGNDSVVQRSPGKYRNQSEIYNTYEVQFQIADKNWNLIFYEDRSDAPAFDSVTIIVFSAGLLFTVFVSAYVVGNSRRQSVIEQLVVDRTQELENYRDEIQQILQSTGEGISGVDLQGRTSFVNKAALEILGFTEDELLYKPQHSLIHHHYADGEIYQQEDCKVYAAYRKGITTTTNEEVFWHKEGYSVPVEYTATPMLDTKGSIRGAVVVFRDIRERKQYENDLIRERKAAEQASKAKSAFVATMSHEIRTPMNGMLGMAQLLQKTGLDETQTEYVDTLISSGNTLLNQINDILDFSRIESGKLQLENNGFNLKEACEEIVSLMKSNAEDKGLKLELIYLDMCPLYVMGDKHRLKQILLNLIGNSIKFTTKGHVTLHVSCETSVNDMADFSIKVIDSGIGIEQEKSNDLFESFTQADTSTTRKYGGTGLGLAITKELTELMHGSLSIDSTPGEGSTFSLHIKLPVAVDISTEKQELPKEVLKFKGHILLVEDNQVNQLVAGTMLKNLGLDVSCAENGQLAIEAFLNDDFDLILMDCQMPVMDGYTATAEIRKLDSGKNIPILALTANVLPEDIERCRMSGMNDCMHKPVELPMLEQTLKQWLPYDIVSE